MSTDHKSLWQLLETVADEESFLNFLTALAADRADEVAREKEQPSSPYGPGCNGWENVTIDDFLYTAAAWGNHSINGTPLKTKETNTWRRCAEIIHMGKIYK